jgi:Uma2 family endonuclease
MNAPLDLHLDKAAFLQWVEGREGRWELVGGVPVMQDTGNRRHSDIAEDFADALRDRLPREAWRIRRGNLSVAVGEETRVPDVMVEPRGLAPRSLVSADAVLLCEVLSPSPFDRDFQIKRELYFRLMSLQAYVVLSQDAPEAWVWQRMVRDGTHGPSGSAPAGFPAEAERFEGMEAALRLDHLGVTVPLSEAYRDVVWE